MESSECESASDTDAEQLATAHCTNAQQSGGGSAPATAKADPLAAEHLGMKRHRAKETTEECAARQYIVADNRYCTLYKYIFICINYIYIIHLVNT